MDFDDSKIENENDAEQRFNDMKFLIIKIHDLALSKDMKFIVYTSLPSMKSIKFG